MVRDFKSQNAWSPKGMYVVTFALVGSVHWGAEEAFAVSRQLGGQVILVGAFTAFGGLLSNLLPNNFKHPLVYWRFRNALSAHRCRQICEKDPRFAFEKS